MNTDLVRDLARNEIERATNKFEKKMRVLRAKYAPRTIYSNLTPIQKGLANELHKNDIYKVLRTDKKCGLAIIETAQLIEKRVV